MSTTLLTVSFGTPAGDTVSKWRKGDVVAYDGAFLKVEGVPAYKGRDVVVTVSTVTEAAYDARPLHFNLPSGTSAAGAREQIGRVVAVGDGWMQIKKITQGSYSGAMGRGTYYVGHGPRIGDAAKAAKVGAKWEREQAARDADLNARVRETLTF